MQRLHAVEDHRPECGHRETSLPAERDAAQGGHGEAASGAEGAARQARCRGAAIGQPGRRSRRVFRQWSRSGAPRPAPRPVWLLQQPQPLPERQSRPMLDGAPLQLLSGPERIEAGWWDSALAERDYFIAQAADGALVWIYRARLPLSAAGDGPGLVHAGPVRLSSGCEVAGFRRRRELRGQGTVTKERACANSRGALGCELRGPERRAVTVRARDASSLRDFMGRLAR